MRNKWVCRRMAVRAAVCVRLAGAYAADKRPIDVIEDNSFLIEEAYNQEPGVVQHIFTAAYTKSGRTHGWGFNFTQEWPVFSQDHQFSYTIPSCHLVEDGSRVSGMGDILLNYRYQLLYEGDCKPAVAPRFSLILPTGNRKKGTGNNVVGYQLNLPVSKKIADAIRASRQRRRDLSSRMSKRRWTLTGTRQKITDLRQYRRQRDLRVVSALSSDARMGRQL